MIGRSLFAVTALLMSSLSQAHAQSAAAQPAGWLVKDFDDFVQIFEGRWDNDRHVFFASDAGMDLSTIAPQQHLEIFRDASTETSSADPTIAFTATRFVEDEAPVQLTHTFTIDLERQKIRHVFSLPDEHSDGENDECVVFWQRKGAQFEGTTRAEACEVFFPRPSGAGAFSVRLTLSSSDFWIESHRGDALTEARFRRARPFECWTAILRGASHGDSGEGMRDWDFRRGVTLHDQGGEAVLITDEDTPRKVRLRLRNVDWPYGTNRPSLTLYVLEGDSDRAISYAWNEGNAERIGINLRWIQASCTHAPDAR